jgi:excisionase family DNA binding protein
MPRQPLRKDSIVSSKMSAAGTQLPASRSLAIQLGDNSPKAAALWAGTDVSLPDGDLPMRLKTVAIKTEVSVKTVRRWIDRGWLRSHKIGGTRVVRRRDLRSFLDQQAGEVTKEAP